MMNKMRPIHPGEILREEFLALIRMTPHALSKALHAKPSRINDIVNKKRGVTADTALRLARYFGGDPQSWLNLQQAYDLKIATNLAMKQIVAEIKPRASDSQALAA